MAKGGTAGGFSGRTAVITGVGIGPAVTDHLSIQSSPQLQEIVASMFQTLPTPRAAEVTNIAIRPLCKETSG